MSKTSLSKARRIKTPRPDESKTKDMLRVRSVYVDHIDWIAEVHTDYGYPTQGSFLNDLLWQVRYSLDGKSKK